MNLTLNWYRKIGGIKFTLCPISNNLPGFYLDILLNFPSLCQQKKTDVKMAMVETGHVFYLHVTLSILKTQTIGLIHDKLSCYPVILHL